MNVLFITMNDIVHHPEYPIHHHLHCNIGHEYSIHRDEWRFHGDEYDYGEP
jgi:hypothetical protein